MDNNNIKLRVGGWGVCPNDYSSTLERREGLQWRLYSVESTLQCTGREAYQKIRRVGFFIFVGITPLWSSHSHPSSTSQIYMSYHIIHYALKPCNDNNKSKEQMFCWHNTLWVCDACNAMLCNVCREPIHNCSIFLDASLFWQYPTPETGLSNWPSVTLDKKYWYPIKIFICMCPEQTGRVYVELPIKVGASQLPAAHHPLIFWCQKMVNISLQTDDVGSNLVRNQPSADADVKETSVLVKIDAGAHISAGALLMAVWWFWCIDTGGGGDLGGWGKENLLSRCTNCDTQQPPWGGRITWLCWICTIVAPPAILTTADLGLLYKEPWISIRVFVGDSWISLFCQSYFKRKGKTVKSIQYTIHLDFVIT